MKDCRYTTYSRFSKYCALLLYPSVAVGSFSGIVIVLYELLSNPAADPIIGICGLLLSFSITVFLVFLAVKSYTMETRKYSVSKHGITLKCGKNVVFFPWNQIHEVAVIAYGASADRQFYQTVICCFLSPCERNSLKKLLKSYIYGINNQDKYVIIDYSNSVFDEFTHCYPGRIIDYQKSQMSL